MIPASGKLGVRVIRRNGCVHAELERPSRPDLAAFLARRPVEDAARLVPMIYNVCAAAQESAIRSAFGLPVPPALAARMEAETLREHVLRLAMVWPSLLGEPADREALVLAGRGLEDREAAMRLRAALFAPLERAPADLVEMESWMSAAATAPARAFRALVSAWEPGWGRADLPLLDPLRPVDWPEAMQSGGAVENSPACRVAGHGLMREIAGRYGHGMLWRMAARLVEVSAMLHGETPALPAAPGSPRPLGVRCS